MKSKLGIILLSTTLAIAAVRQVEAQRRGLVDITPSSDRHGFWLHFGLGAGDESFKYADESHYDTSSPTKPAFTLRMGGTVNPNLRLGVELNGWGDTYTDVDGYQRTDYLGGLMLIGQFYPSRTLGLFVKGGAGLSRSGVSIEGGQGTHEDGFAWTAGLGYEIRLSRSVFITPTVDFMQHRSDVRDGPALYDRLAMIGVGITFQPQIR